ncbi:hypothetical protein RhiirC2_868866 [Rhizophagus irregularis]|uniref:Protein kinase domain-containing protein n=1 Tax=Rhizophagus irregularis TaxID=588596 RepID=A0A2N1MUI4_9GLOM|nr:hypothetical protein RhiirC2_868866 [Rhizophagus irregularis]
MILYVKKLHFKECVTKNRLKALKILLDDEVLQIIYNCYDSQDFKNLTEIDSGGSALVYDVYWKSTSRFAIKKFNKSSNKESIINEIHLTGMVNSHQNIIQFYGITKLKECWRHNPDERPSICKVIEVLDSINPIDLIDPKNNNVSTDLNSNESESTENEDSDLPSCEEYDINSDRYNI